MRSLMTLTIAWVGLQALFMFDGLSCAVCSNLFDNVRPNRYGAPPFQAPIPIRRKANPERLPRLLDRYVSRSHQHTSYPSHAGPVSRERLPARVLQTPDEMAWQRRWIRLVVCW